MSPVLRCLVSAIVIVMVTAALGAPGSIIRSFSLSNQPFYGVRGLAKDWADGNIWAAGPDFLGLAELAKFNATTGSLIISWSALLNSDSCYDIGYGYLYGGNRVIVLGNDSAPAWRMWRTTGSYVGPFPQQPPTVTVPYGIGCDWGGTFCFATTDTYTNITRWSGAAWATWFMFAPLFMRGNDTGWGRLFVVSNPPGATIREYRGIYNATGSLSRAFYISNWSDSRAVVGLAIGRVNATGTEESVFVATYTTSAPYIYLIYEISVGDITGTDVTPTSLGKIKALYE